MSWEVKYRAEFTDIEGVNWQFDIEEESETAFTIEYFQCTGNPLMIEYYGEDDIFEQPIVGSKATLNVWSPDNFEYIELFTSDPLQFRVSIYQASTLFWRGWKLAESYTERYDSKPFEATITATDGLALLKEFEFTELGYEPDERPPLYLVLVKMFEKLHGTDIFEIQEYVDIYSQTMNTASTDSMFAQCGVSPDLFKTKNVYEALEIILQTFNAVIKQYGGIYYIYRPKYLKEDSMTGRKINKTSIGNITVEGVTFSTVQTLQRSDNTSTIRDIEGGSLTFLPQAKKHIVNYDLGTRESILDRWAFHNNDDFIQTETGSGWEATDWTTFQTNVYPVSLVLPGEEEGVYLTSSAYSYIQHEGKRVEERSPSFKILFDYNVKTLDVTEVSGDIQYSLALYTNEARTTGYNWTIHNGTIEWRDNFIVGSLPRLKNCFTVGDYQWSGWNTATITVDSVPDDGILVLTIYSAYLTNVPDQAYLRLALRNVKIQMAPAVGGNNDGIGYTNDLNTFGRVIEVDRYLGSGHTSARYTVNQLINYDGILNKYVNNYHENATIEPGNDWYIRGTTDYKSLLELTSDELAEQYSRPRQLIDLPLYSIGAAGAYVHPIKRLTDNLNLVSAVERTFNVNIKSFEPRERRYSLTLTEII